MIAGWLTRRSNGLWLLTAKRPIIATVGDSNLSDAYPEPGDALAFNNMCPRAVESIWGIRRSDCERLQSIPVVVFGHRREL